MHDSRHAPLSLPSVPLDDWTPPAPCVEFGRWTPKVQMRVRTDVPSHHVTVGSNPVARQQAYDAMLEFLEAQVALKCR